MLKWHSRADYEEILSISKKNDQVPNAAVDSDEDFKVTNHATIFLSSMNVNLAKAPEVTEEELLE